MPRSKNWPYVGIGIVIGSGIGLLVSLFFGGNIAIGITIGAAIGLLKTAFWDNFGSK